MPARRGCSVHGTRALLDDVRQLVGQRPLVGRRARRLPVAQDDLVPDGVGVGVHRLRRRGGGASGVDANIREVRAEARLHALARGPVEGGAGAMADDPLDRQIRARAPRPGAGRRRHSRRLAGGASPRPAAASPVGPQRGPAMPPPARPGPARDRRVLSVGLPARRGPAPASWIGPRRRSAASRVPRSSLVPPRHLPTRLMSPWSSRASPSPSPAISRMSVSPSVDRGVDGARSPPRRPRRPTARARLPRSRGRLQVRQRRPRRLVVGPGLGPHRPDRRLPARLVELHGRHARRQPALGARSQASGRRPPHLRGPAERPSSATRPELGIAVGDRGRDGRQRRARSLRSLATGRRRASTGRGSSWPGAGRGSPRPSRRSRPSPDAPAPARP